MINLPIIKRLIDVSTQKSSEKLLKCIVHVINIRFALLVGSVNIGAIILMGSPAKTIGQQPTWIENLANVQTDIEEFDSENTVDPWGKQLIDLNKADRASIANLHVLNTTEVNALLTYRQGSGPFMSLFELQAVPGLEMKKIRALVPFVKISQPSTLLGKITPLRLKKHQIQYRWRRGNRLAESDHAGLPFSTLLRYDYNNQYNIKGGILMENDAGEKFGDIGTQLGFDHMSAYAAIQGIRPWFTKIILGDHQIHLGQGLIYSLGFQLGKTLQVSRLNRSGPTVRPNRSLDENRFHRGIAAEFYPMKNLHLSVFTSFMRQDATIQKTADSIPYFRSVNTSGYHRDSVDLSRKHTLPHHLTGFRISWARHGHRISINWLQQRFDIEADPGTHLRHLYSFRGKELYNASLDYQWLFGNAQLFGEMATDRNWQIAQVHGLLVPIHSHLDVGIHLRVLPQDYLNFRAQPFADGNGGKNEKGWFVSLTYRLSDHWQINGFIDHWNRPWLSYRRNQPSQGKSYRIRIQHQKRHKYQLYLQCSVDSDLEENTTGHSKITLWPVSTRFKYFQSFHLTEAWEWRTRIHYNMVTSNGNIQSSGWLFAQDLLFRPMLFPISFTTRMAWFNTTDFDSRIYVYENNVLNAFTIPAYQGRGFRYYLNVRTKIRRSLTLEARIAATSQISTHYLREPTRESPTITFQARWSF